MKNQLLEFVNKKVSEGAKVVLIGKKELKWELPHGVYRLELLNDDPKNILQTTCGKNRRMLSNNIKLQDLELIDGIELHCQGGIIENGSIWIKKDLKISCDSYQLITKVKCFIPILYEDDIYANLETIKHKRGNLSEDCFIFNFNINSMDTNAIKSLKQVIIIYLTNF